MAEAIIYNGYVNIRSDSTCLAQLTDLPGCYALAPDPDTAIAQLAERIPAYYAWLQRHDEYTPSVQGPFQITFKEVQRSAPAAAPHVGSFFTPDAEPVTTEDLDWYLSLLDWAFADFSAFTASLPDAERAASLIAHVAQTQLWLISRLESSPTVAPFAALPGTPPERLRQIWQASLARLRATTDDERQQSLSHDNEPWTLRRILRSAIVHLREHTGMANAPA